MIVVQGVTIFDSEQKVFIIRCNRHVKAIQRIGGPKVHFNNNLVHIVLGQIKSKTENPIINRTDPNRSNDMI